MLDGVGNKKRTNSRPLVIRPSAYLNSNLDLYTKEAHKATKLLMYVFILLVGTSQNDLKLHSE